MAPAKALFETPAHPYTKALCDAAPVPDPALRRRERIVLAGEIPSSIDPPKGCRFHPRCPYATEVCKREEPKLLPCAALPADHLTACHHTEALLAKRGNVPV